MPLVVVQFRNKEALGVEFFFFFGIVFKSI